MNNLQKSLSTCLLATAALLVGASSAWAQVPLGAASEFSVLGGTNVTCTAGAVIGDVGVSPGSAVPFTNTGCTIAGAMPPATNAAAALARTDFLSAYAAARSMPCTQTLLSTITGPVTLPPGVYCTDAALTGTGVLTLDGGGNANAVWVFKIGTLATGALTGTNFSVVMAGRGQPCNVFWAPSAGVTMTTSALVGTVLAGNAIDGSITMTGGTVAGRALANVAVTMTGASVIGCDVLPVPPGSSTCKDKDHHWDKDHHKCDRDSGKHRDCDEQPSGHLNPFGWNDKDGKSDGKGGRR
jgi:hypothetical protein